MADECITLISGCEVEVIEVEDCSVEVIIATDCGCNSGGGGGGQVDSVVGGTNVTVDDTDPVNPIVNVPDVGVENVIAGTNVSVDTTDPANPIVEVPNIGGQVDSIVAGANITVDSVDPANPIVSAQAGLITIDASIIIYVDFVTGNDTTGDGSFGNPYKTPNKALSSLDSQFITENGFVTISCASGAYLLTAPLKCNNSNPHKIKIQGALLTLNAIADIHYVPRDGVYPGIISNKFVVTNFAGGYNPADAALNLSLIEARYATRFYYTFATASDFMAVKVNNGHFPEIDRVAFVNNDAAGGNFVNACFEVTNNSSIQVGTVGVFGFGYCLEIYDKGSFSALDIENANSEYSTIASYSEGSTYIYNLVSAAPNFEGLYIESGSEFSGSVKISGCPFNAITAYDAEVHIHGIPIDVTGNGGAAFFAYNGRIIADDNAKAIYDNFNFLDAFNSVINLSNAAVSETVTAAISVDGSRVDLAGLVFDIAGGDASVTAVNGSVITLGASQAFATYSPPIGQVDASGNFIFSNSEALITLPDVEVGSASLTPLDMGLSNVISTENNIAFYKTITTDTILTFALLRADASVFYLYVTNGGAFNTTFTGVTWLTGAAPDLEMAGTDIIQFFSKGAQIFGNPIGHGEGLTALANVGTGEGTIYRDVTGTTGNLKSLKAGTGVVITNNADEIQIDATGVGGGEANTSSNSGTGAGLALPKSGIDLPFKSLTAAVQIAITENANDIQLGVNQGQLDHTQIQNIGTKSHATIDSELDANAAAIGQNALDIAQNASDITNKENYLGLPAADGYILSSSLVGARSWIPFTGGVKTINVNTTLYVTVSGSDITGDGTVGNPWATPNKALQYLDDIFIIDGAIVTILCGAGDYNLTEPMVCNNIDPRSILLSGAPLLKGAIDGIHYVPRDGVYPGTATSTKLLMNTQMGDRLDGSADSNLILMQQTYATRFNYLTSAVTGTAVVEVSSGMFPKVDLIAFINEDELAVGLVDYCFLMSNGSSIEFGDIAIFGFDWPITINEASTITSANKIVTSGSGGQAITANQNSNAYIEMLYAAALGNAAIYLQFGSTFIGNVEAAGTPFEAIYLEYDSRLELTIGQPVISGCGGVVYSYIATALFGDSGLISYNNDLCILSENSRIYFYDMSVELTTFAFLDVINSEITFYFLNIANDGGAADFTAFDSSRIYVDSEIAYATYSPPIDTFDSSGNFIFNYTSDLLKLSLSQIQDQSFKPVDMGLDGVMNTSQGLVFYKTATVDIALVTSVNQTDSSIFYLYLTNGGAFNVTFPTITWLTGSAPSLQVAGVDIIMMFSRGATVYGLKMTDVGNLDHSILNNRDIADQHPIAAITGLNTALSGLQTQIDGKLGVSAQAADSALLEGQNGAFYRNRTNHTGVQAPDTVTFPNIGTADLTNLKHFIDHIWSAGLTLGGVVTDAGASTVNLASSEINFRESDSDHSGIISMAVGPETGIPIAFDQFIIVYADYNAGSPIILTTNDLGSLDFRTEVPIAGCVSNGVTVDILQVYGFNSDGLNKIQHRLLDFGLAHVPGGTILGESGTSNISVTPGKFYLGVKPISDDAYDTSGIDTFTYWYEDGAGGWTAVTDQTQIDVDNYDDGSGTLDNLNNGRYSQSWVYLNVHDGRSVLHVIYGHENTGNVNNVISVPPPSVLPPTLNIIGILIGRVIVREGEPVFIQVDSAFASQFDLGGVTVHNTLSGLQGGAANEFYHLTAAEYASLQTFPVTDRVEWKGVWTPGTYLLNQMVIDGGWTMICNQPTTDQRAGPTAVGDEFDIYEGTLTQVNVSGKQLIIGVLFSTTEEDGYLRGFRIYAFAGQTYEGYLLQEVGGETVVYPIGGLTAVTDGWRSFNVAPKLFLAGSTVAVFATVRKIDATPVITALNYDYQAITATATTPSTGQIVQANRGQSSPMRIHYIDNDAGDNTAYLQSLTVGDLIHGAGLQWIIQGITLQAGFIDFVVAPAEQGYPDGVQSFDFIQVDSQTLSYGFDSGYWASDPSLFGLFGLDTGYNDIIPTNDAYGLDVTVQRALIPTDWDLVSTGNIDVTGGGHESFLGLTDTPNSYENQAGKVPVVDALEEGLGFSSDLVLNSINTNEAIAQASKLAAIDNIVNSGTVYNVFLYLPSIHDDDNGAWIDEAGSQSYYLEPLNTATRGATKKFPKAGVLIVADATSTTTLYDLSVPDLPMWMVFKKGTASWTVGNMGYVDGGTTASVYMKNGVLYIASGNTHGYEAINFKTDNSFRRVNYASNAGHYAGNIAQRTDGLGWLADITLDDIIIGGVVNDIAITSDGKSNNITYVATNAGLSRIAPDGSVSNWTDLGNSVNIVNNVAVFEGYVYFGADNSSSGKYNQVQPVNIPLVDSRYTDWIFVGQNVQVWTTTAIPYHFNGEDSRTNDIANKAIGTHKSLTKLYPNPDDWGASMVANITSSWSSGIMHGDIRGAWLASVDPSTLVGVELIINGNFSVALGAEWVAYNSGVLSIVSGALRVTNGAAAFGSAVQSFATVVGESYVLTFDTVNASANLSMRLSTNDASGGTGDIIDEVGTLTNNSPYKFTFIATATTLYLRLFGDGVNGNFFEFDNVSVRLADADRSYKNNGLAVHGTVQRTPVATGAELNAYSGFSVSNYLQQAYNSDLDFGTGDMYIKGWFNQPSLNNYKALYSRIGGSTFNIDTGLNGYLRTSGLFSLTSTIITPLNKWNFVEVKKIGSDVNLYINNALVASNTTASSMTDITAVLRLGERVDTTASFNGSMALWHAGGTVPTKEQSTIMYEQEKRLFNENAKCTLQGASSEVKAVDYDESSNVVTACSADHLTKFNGLIVVEDRAEVATSVSTACDKEITGV